MISAVLGWRANRATARQTAGAQQVEQAAAARRDTIAERDALIDRLVTQQTAQDARITALEARMVDADRREDRLWQHIGVMEAHIWRGDGPPPPERPAL